MENDENNQNYEIEGEEEQIQKNDQNQIEDQEG